MAKKLAAQMFQGIAAPFFTSFAEHTVALLNLLKKIISGKAFANITSTSDAGYLLMETIEVFTPLIKEYDNIITVLF